MEFIAQPKLTNTITTPPCLRKYDEYSSAYASGYGIKISIRYIYIEMAFLYWHFITAYSNAIVLAYISAPSVDCFYWRRALFLTLLLFTEQMSRTKITEVSLQHNMPPAISLELHIYIFQTARLLLIAIIIAISRSYNKRDVISIAWLWWCCDYSVSTKIFNISRALRWINMPILPKLEEDASGDSFRDGIDEYDWLGIRLTKNILSPIQN